MKLSKETARLELVPLRPYSLVLTAARLSAFPEVVDRFDGKTYRRLFYVGRSPVLLEAEQRGAPGRAILEVKLTGRDAASKEAKAAARRVLEKVMGTSSDVRPFYRNFRNDPLLGPLIRDFRGLRVAGRSTVWETLVQIVVSQQINLKFAHSILCELARELGRRARFDGTLYFTFPSPARVARLKERELRKFRLSRGKAGTFLRLAKAFQSGTLSEEKLETLTDDEAIELLTSIKGIGRWTAEFTLLRGLSRFDVFPGGDLGVVKYLAQGLLGHAVPAREEDMRAFAERWRPYRGLALIYSYAELARRSKKRTQ
jgi:DNA-3-methyladenine glycosylase II